MMYQSAKSNPVKSACWKILAILMLAAAGNTYAYQLFYDRVSWETAVTEDLISDNFVNSISPADSITFDSGVISSRSRSRDSNYVGSSSEAYLGSITSSSTLTWVFPWKISAFGFDMISYNPGSLISGNFDGQGNVSFIPAVGNNIFNGFVGIIGASRFDTIVFSGPNRADSFVVDNLSFSKAPAIPEPATLLLMGLGLFGIGCRRTKTV